MVGIREKGIYWTRDFNDICNYILEEGKKRNLDIKLFQSKIECEIINEIHKAYYDNYDSIIINQGAVTHYSYAILDAIKAVNIKTIEVHLYNIHSREEFRHKFVIASACVDQISGFKEYGYVMAMDALRKLTINN